MIKILIVDDHAIFREGLKTLIRRKLHSDLTVVGEASDGKEAVDAVLLQKPDVVLMDIQMPVMNGILATQTLKTLEERPGIIALSSFNDSAAIKTMLNAGASGFLLKSVGAEELLRAVRTVHAGGMHIAQDSFMNGSPAFTAPGVAGSGLLSGREREIVVLMCQQLTTKEIASKLGLDVRSVETHRENIMKKLDVKNAVGIAVYAAKAGWV